METLELGAEAPIGNPPKKMHAWLVRKETFDEPINAFNIEFVDVPECGDDDVLVYVKAAGVNYNNVWAALGVPVDVIAARKKVDPRPYHIGGSDASGIVIAVGKNVTNVKPGDAVVIHCGTWDIHSPLIANGLDPMFDPSFKIWGYETNDGSFAQITKVQAHQCLPKPKNMSWEAAACYTLVGATAYRMLMGYSPHTITEGSLVLIWGGAGGLGSMAIQIVTALGGRAIAVVSSEEKFEYCEKLGAIGCINRKDFDHWGQLPNLDDDEAYREWFAGAKAFGKKFWDIAGQKGAAPDIVFEHPGEATIPTSIFMCQTGGMVVICAGTTGFNANVDLRYLWMRQKCLQGSHFANDDNARGFQQLVLDGHIDPCLGDTFSWEDLPKAHQLMRDNKHKPGNMAILVGATKEGQGIGEGV